VREAFVPNAEPLVHLVGIRQSYGGRCVLDLPELEICSGEFLAALGPSGAGKTTLLRLLSLIEAPHVGRLRIQGETVVARPPLALRRRITTVFQRPRLLPRSVTRNVALGLEMRGVSDPQRVEDLIERVGLSDFAHRPALKLSGGEQQRVAVARALAIRPQILLLDEATANLDPQNTSIIENLLVQEHRTHGTTIVFVTHNQFQAKRIARTCMMLLEGRIVAHQPVEEFFADSAAPEVRAFLSGELLLPADDPARPRT
jgi:tungstate transport system ATP-binding protein